VDDEPNVLSSLKRIFLDDDYIILTANSGKEGLEIMNNEEVQIIISDYRMPVMNGVEFLKEARLLQPDTVRIVLSGYADAGAIVSAINEGQIYKFIPKPWNDDELKVTISNAIERYNLFKQNKLLTEQLKTRNEELSALNKQLESLLDEKSKSLAFTSEVLNTHQNIIDSVPIGIIGVDLNYNIVLSNRLWQDFNANPAYMIGSNISQTPLSEIFNKLFSKPEDKDRVIVENNLIEGKRGKIVGSFFLDYYGEKQGIILAFIDEYVLYS
ncbi:MAG: response regulator, partial [Thermodesulfovibrionales bacterium]|nr:response regulator [Thermodesulfovibrionales bacterium]